MLLTFAVTLVSVGVLRFDEIDYQGPVALTFVISDISGAIVWVYAVATTAARLTDGYIRDRREAPDAYAHAFNEPKFSRKGH